MLSPVLSLKPQSTTISLLFSKHSSGSKYLNNSNTNKAISLTYNTLQSPQPSYLRQMFTIQPSHSMRSSSALTLLRPSVTSSLKYYYCCCYYYIYYYYYCYHYYLFVEVDLFYCL